MLSNVGCSQQNILDRSDFDVIRLSNALPITSLEARSSLMMHMSSL